LLHIHQNPRLPAGFSAFHRRRDAVLFPPVWQPLHPLFQTSCQTGDPLIAALSLALLVDRLLQSH
ncbi:hypothetical protein, partial [Sphingomonas sp. LH128]|uniref:hypothetical protein n=1 Tax=Sphingomonas sp. LH128 TaxID=473781 RepID=UPI002E102A25